MKIPLSNCIAAFDFDGTLTRHDSLVPFLFTYINKFKAGLYLLLLLPAFMGFLFGSLTRQAVKEKILTRFFKGIPLNRVEEWGKEYACKKLDSYLRPEAMEKLLWHQKQGHRCLLVSASLDFYLKPWAKKHGFEEVIASKLEVNSSGNLTGLLKGMNCWGSEKSKRLLAYLGPKEGFELYAYGDSRGDLEMLELADYPFYRRFK